MLQLLIDNWLIVLGISVFCLANILGKGGGRDAGADSWWGDCDGDGGGD